MVYRPHTYQMGATATGTELGRTLLGGMQTMNLSSMRIGMTPSSCRCHWAVHESSGFGPMMTWKRFQRLRCVVETSVPWKGSSRSITSTAFQRRSMFQKSASISHGVGSDLARDSWLSSIRGLRVKMDPYPFVGSPSRCHTLISGLLVLLTVPWHRKPNRQGLLIQWFTCIQLQALRHQLHQ